MKFIGYLLDHLLFLMFPLRCYISFLTTNYKQSETATEEAVVPEAFKRQDDLSFLQ